MKRYVAKYRVVDGNMRHQVDLGEQPNLEAAFLCFMQNHDTLKKFSALSIGQRDSVVCAIWLGQDGTKAPVDFIRLLHKYGVSLKDGRRILDRIVAAKPEHGPELVMLDDFSPSIACEFLSLGIHVIETEFKVGEE